MTNNDVVAKIVIMMVENDASRVEIVKPWMPAHVRLFWIERAGAAVGLFGARNVSTDTAGVMLDFDLVDARSLRYGEKPLAGLDVARKMVGVLEIDTPVLVHSMSRDRDQAINMLRTAGFPVTQIPFAELTREKLEKWLDEVRERYEYYQQR